MDYSNSDQALAAVNSFKRTNSNDLITNANNKYGVGGLQTKVDDFNTLTGNLSSALAAVDPSVTARTSGTLTTEGQRSALVSRERAPIAGQLTETTSQAQKAQDQLTTAKSEASGEATRTAADEDAKYQSILTTYNILNAKEAQQREQANSDRQFNESTRQFNVQQAAAAKAASSKSAAPAKATKNDVASFIVTSLNKLKGKDGNVSNETWQNALNDWTSIGGTVKQFWQNYGTYVNDRYKASYAGYSSR
jgi:hypothetical protein